MRARTADLDAPDAAVILIRVNRVVVRILVVVGLLGLTSCGLPGAAVRSLGAVGRSVQSLGRSAAALQ